MATESRSCHGGQRAPRVKKGRKRGGRRASPQRAHLGGETEKRKKEKKKKFSRDGEGRSCEQRKGNYCVIVGV